MRQSNAPYCATGKLLLNRDSIAACRPGQAAAPGAAPEDHMGSSKKQVVLRVHALALVADRDPPDGPGNKGNMVLEMAVTLEQPHKAYKHLVFHVNTWHPEARQQQGECAAALCACVKYTGVECYGHLALSGS